MKKTPLSLFLPSALMFVAAGVSAAPVIWGGPQQITNDSDVIISGTAAYAYTWSNTGTTINTVAFTGTSSNTGGGTDVSLSTPAGVITNNTTAFWFNAAPASGLSAGYKLIAQGADYHNSTNGVFNLTLNNLTPGHYYAAQVWVNDSRTCCGGRTETLNGGANTVTLRYNTAGGVNGGLGQYSVGHFEANATTQAFAMQGAGSTQINALQLRDVTNLGYWTGLNGSAWDNSATANFATNLFNSALTNNTFTAAKALTSNVVFGDNYWNSNATTAVSQNTVDIAAGGVSAGRVTFNNSAVNYTLNSGDATGITGATELAFTGTGSRTLTGSHTYTGATSITGGTVTLSGAATLAGGTYAGAIYNAGTLALNSSANQTLSGVISGAGNLGKNGAGVLTLSGANTFAGSTTISAGRVVAGNAAAFGAAANTITVASGASLDFNAQTLQGYTNNISIAGTGTIPTLGALGNSNPTANLNSIRGITLTADASIGGDGGRWDIGRLDFNANPAVTVDHITGGGFTLTKVGTSYLGLLTGAANLGGFVIEGGTVAPHENTALGAGPVTMKPGTILQPWGGTTMANAFNLQGGTIQTDGFAETFTGAVNVSGPATLNAINGNLVFNGNISGGGSFNKTGAFSVLLGGNNSGFTGTHTNSVSNTILTSATAGSATAAYVVNAGTLSNTTAGVVTQNLGSLGGSGGIVGNNVAGGAVTYSIGALGTDTIYSGNIVDSVGGGGTTALTKVGTGKLTLSGINTYTGPTIITAGELAVTGSLTGSAITFSSGAKLSGTGSITTTNQSIALAAGSFLSPGSSPGNLTINTGTGSLDLSAAVNGSPTGALVWEIDSTPSSSDLVTLTGTLNIGSGVLEWNDFAFTSGSLTPYTTITLIDSNTTIAGTLGSTLYGSLGGGLEGILSFADSDTNLVLTVVPEPGSAALSLLALAALSTRRRRA